MTANNGQHETSELLWKKFMLIILYIYPISTKSFSELCTLLQSPVFGVTVAYATAVPVPGGTVVCATAVPSPWC